MKRFLALLLLTALTGCAQSATGWTTYGGDSTRALVADERGPRRERLLWVANLAATDPGSPVVDQEGNVYVPHSGGSLTRIDRDGTVQWRYDSWVSQDGARPPLAGIGSEGEVLISTLHHEQSFRLNKQGDLLDVEPWLPWPAANNPAIIGNGYTVVCNQYVAGADSVGLRIYGLAPEGEPLWSLKFEDEDAVWSGSIPVLQPDGTAYVFVETTGPGNNRLLAIAPDGAIAWESEFVSEETRAVGLAIAAAEDGTVYFGSDRVEDINRLYSPGWLYAVDKDGNLRWRVDAGQRVVQIMAAPDYVVANVLRTRLLALNADGNTRWEFEFEGWESNCLMDSRGTIYLAGVKDGRVWLRAVSNRGRLLWDFDSGQAAGAVSFLALDQGRLYLATDTGMLLAFGD
ncbi:MAG: PQQ-like beta-propeller repeat protein [Firmicutes bacterium]|nr:PQQ-like beta-propeller repeat protein [Bacillota bacterium]